MQIDRSFLKTSIFVKFIIIYLIINFKISILIKKFKNQYSHFETNSINYSSKKKKYERRLKTNLRFQKLRICYEDFYVKKIRTESNLT